MGQKEVRIDEKIYELLYYVPADAVGAADPTDLDPEDVPQARVDGVLELLEGSDDLENKLRAARLLANWGSRKGFNYLVYAIEKPHIFEGFYEHNLRGYDDTFRILLRDLVGYFSCLADMGLIDEARAEIFNPIKKIIELSNVKPFEIRGVFRLIEEEGFTEYTPLLREHLEAITLKPDIHRWKIYDVLSLLLKVDTDYAISFLKLAGTTLSDFDLKKSH